MRVGRPGRGVVRREHAVQCVQQEGIEHDTRALVRGVRAARGGHGVEHGDVGDGDEEGAKIDGQRHRGLRPDRTLRVSLPCRERPGGELLLLSLLLLLLLSNN